jgi:tetratricopeptide (TPR) repeat protein
MAPRIGVRVIIIVAVGGLWLQPGFGQGRAGASPPAGGSTSTGSTGTATTGTGVKSPTSTTPTTPSTTPQPGNLPQPIYISGRVLMEDGNPPTESVTIERVCGGSPHAEGYTDSKGYFGIQLGQSRGVLQDASETGGSGGIYGDTKDPNIDNLGARTPSGSSSTSGAFNSDMRYMNCDLQARHAGFRSQSVSLANRRAMDNPDIGIILLHRLTPTEGTTISAVSLSAPKEARKAFEKGQEAIHKKKWDEAAKAFQKAVDIYPGYATAWYELGRLQAAGGAPDTARISLECAMKADPKYAAPYVELASLDVTAKKWKEVATITDRGLRLDSFDYPELFFFNGVANYYLKNSDVAEKNVRQAVKLDTQHRYPQSAYLLGLILTQRREYGEAVVQFRDFLKLAPESADAKSAKERIDQIEQLTAQGGMPAPKQDQ